MATVVITNTTSEPLRVGYQQAGVPKVDVLPASGTRSYTGEVLTPETLSLLVAGKITLVGTLDSLPHGMALTSVSAELQTTAWVATQTVKPGTIVEHEGALFIARTNSMGVEPAADSDDWHAMGSGGGGGGGSGSLTPPFVVLADGPTITCVCDDTKATQNVEVTLGGNRALAITGLMNGMTGVIIVKQDATGSRTLTLPAGSRVQNSGNGAVTLTTLANAHDVLSWTYNGTHIYWTVGNHFN